MITLHQVFHALHYRVYFSLLKTSTPHQAVTKFLCDQLFFMMSSRCAVCAHPGVSAYRVRTQRSVSLRVSGIQAICLNCSGTQNVAWDFDKKQIPMELLFLRRCASRPGSPLAEWYVPAPAFLSTGSLMGLYSQPSCLLFCHLSE